MPGRTKLAETISNITDTYGKVFASVPLSVSSDQLIFMSLSQLKEVRIQSSYISLQMHLTPITVLSYDIEIVQAGHPLPLYFNSWGQGLEPSYSMTNISPLVETVLKSHRLGYKFLVVYPILVRD